VTGELEPEIISSLLSHPSDSRWVDLQAALVCCGYKCLSKECLSVDSNGPVVAGSNNFTCDSAKLLPDCRSDVLQMLEEELNDLWTFGVASVVVLAAVGVFWLLLVFKLVVSSSCCLI